MSVSINFSDFLEVMSIRLMKICTCNTPYYLFFNLNLSKYVVSLQPFFSLFYCNCYNSNTVALLSASLFRLIAIYHIFLFFLFNLCCQFFSIFPFLLVLRPLFVIFFINFLKFSFNSFSFLYVLTTNLIAKTTTT